jgi:tetratricopeptide (TPR) repeat protein
MNHLRLRRLDLLLAAAFLGLVTVAPSPTPAMESTPPSAGPSGGSQQQGSAGVKRKKTKSTSGQKQQRSERELNDGFWVAYNLIYKDHDYAAGIAKLHSLGHDDLAEIANLIGYSSRKLGRYEDSKLWYERALAADPAHARTWSYYGMWHAEQGNLLKARDYLAKVESLCGTKCREYTELKGVIAGTRTY